MKKTSTHILEESEIPYGEIVIEPTEEENMIMVENYHRSASGILKFQSPAMDIENVIVHSQLVPCLFGISPAQWQRLQLAKTKPKTDGEDRYRLRDLIAFIYS